MSHIVDDEPPIKTGPASQAYRDNYDRIFRSEEPDTVAQCTLKADPRGIIVGIGKPISWSCSHCGTTGTGGQHWCMALGNRVVDFDSWTHLEK